ncbi:Cupredoxin [Hyaloraphidium curvatum]|nr:Cupredoxin [Hyaloraphidium curvatum]
MAPCRHRFHSSLQPTTLFCYNGVYPGPTVVARRFRSTQITWTNALPATHMLRAQLRASAPNPYVNITTNATVHLHGAQSLGGANDGHPLTAYKPGRSQASWYPNLQRATHLFYHDHMMGATGPNFYSGLYGNYMIRDGVEDWLISKKRLPPRDREIPLVIADKLVSSSGGLVYALSGGVLVGNVMSVNGKLYPYTAVQATTYRFRILNASNGRFLNLWLETAFPGVRAWIVGNDGGLLDAPVEVRNLTRAPVGNSDRRVLVEGSGRVDLVVDFSGVWRGGNSTTDKRGWREVKLVNSASYYWPGTPLPSSSSVYSVMQFRVARPRANTSQSRTTLPSKFPADPYAATPASQMAELAAQQSGDRRVSRFGYARAPQGHPADPSQVPVSRYRTHSFSVAFDAELGVPLHLLNGLRFMDPATEMPVQGTYENWRICNPMNIAHPVHLHAVTMAVTYRRPFDVAVYAASGARQTVVYTGRAADIPREDRGWKDMVVALPGECVNVTVAVEGFAGEFGWHCHSLEHEDGDMMRPLRVLPAGSQQVFATVAPSTTTTAAPTRTSTSLTTTTAFTRTPEPLGPGPFATHVVEVAPLDDATGKYLMAYRPSNLTVNLGDTVRWVWSADPGQAHSVEHYADASICRRFRDFEAAQRLFSDGSGSTGRYAPFQFSYQFVNRGRWTYACSVGEHCLYKMAGAVTVV